MSDELRDLLTDSGFTQGDIEYTLAKGIRTVATLALLANDTDRLFEILAVPYEKGVEMANNKFLCDHEAPVWRAILQAAWEDARTHRAATSAAARSTAHGSPTEAPAAATTLTVATRTPTQLAPGVWAAQVQKWETRFKPHRKFPQKMILGADVVLARLLHERSTHNFTCLHLGELLHHRSFTATGEVNQAAIRDKDKVLGFDPHTGMIAEKLNQGAEPRTAWSMLDALEACKWAWVWAEYGQEDDVDPLTEYFTRLVRQRSDNLDGVRNLWTATGLQLAMAMKNGETLAEASTNILQDHHWLQEQLAYRPSNRWPDSNTYGGQARARTRSAPPRRSTQKGGKASPTKGGKGKGTPRPGKGGGKGKGPSKGREVCNNWNRGRRNDPNCPRQHVCSKCGRSNHTAEDCWTPLKLTERPE